VDYFEVSQCIKYNCATRKLGLNAGETMSNIIELSNKLLTAALLRASGLLHGPNPYLEYPIKPKRRYDESNPHWKLLDIIDRNRNLYKQRLESFLQFKDSLREVAIRNPAQSQDPCWHNLMIPELDSVALYSFLCLNNPRKYYEIGSGSSTKFARRAITEYGLQTKIVSIDPEPRAEIDPICDRVIRERLEDLDINIFDDLQTDDVLFVDGSHRSCMNSDVTVLFLDVIPRLASGVLVEIHDIFLPYDYLSEWKERYYSEQYLLATYILAEGNKLDIVLPNWFVSVDAELSAVLAPLWNLLGMDKGYGSSFWLRTR